MKLIIRYPLNLHQTVCILLQQNNNKTQSNLKFNINYLDNTLIRLKQIVYKSIPKSDICNLKNYCFSGII